MLVEFDTFDDLVGLSIDMVEDVPADDCVDSLVLSSSDAVDRPTCFVHCFGFAILNELTVTLTFHVRMVPSYDPLTKVLFMTNRLQTRFVCPMNWFRISP